MTPPKSLKVIGHTEVAATPYYHFLPAPRRSCQMHFLDPCQGFTRRRVVLFAETGKQQLI
jgi:hypothetical protein